MTWGGPSTPRPGLRPEQAGGAQRRLPACARPRSFPASGPTTVQERGLRLSRKQLPGRAPESPKGTRVPGLVEVVEGLAVGDLVVTAGQQRVQRDGTAVRVVELGSPAPQGAASSAQNGAPSGALKGAPNGAAPVADAAAPAGRSKGASAPAQASSVAEVTPLPGPNPCGPAAKAPASQRQPA